MLTMKIIEEITEIECKLYTLETHVLYKTMFVIFLTTLSVLLLTAIFGTVDSVAFVSRFLLFVGVIVLIIPKRKRIGTITFSKRGFNIDDGKLRFMEFDQLSNLKIHIQDYKFRITHIVESIAISSGQENTISFCEASINKQYNFSLSKKKALKLVDLLGELNIRNYYP